ncbi:NUMOD4 motif-containing HNH endonuclease [Limosilactobacillus reuteri]|uniref:NUMOD4 motif-containing HNH endonuclease n=1 Tax=Limosilactobacillus reuteri TaxID=1598 RepID=UPI001E32AC7B|nr:NUMOD4 motif-containing HNH endonuclease [Limosilactobacillus reuteri]MCC4427778.1 NUMOD4 motif-containing HNH endonuclease [Limosilactobacillus reuteri]MCC4431697.1 NUMOD4 motif-containing HNH endonuclease [Limosilactobacillus reuteri]MCC4433972.1 NUMOD4 motif-containing HNH endonuclease [Limosilactobacillus reuteri]
MSYKDKESIEYLSQNEVWRDIKGYEGLYQVSSFGNVRSLDRVVVAKNGRKMPKKGKMLKRGVSKYGYWTVGLCKHSHGKLHLVHRLVALTFLPRVPGKNIVNHKDENKLNSNVSNLEWCDTQYNVTYGTGIARRANAHSKKINVYSAQDGKYLCSGTLHELAPFTQMPFNTMRDYANGRVAQGVCAYKFVYVDEDSLPVEKMVDPQHAYAKLTSNVVESAHLMCYDPKAYILTEYCTMSSLLRETGLRETQVYTALGKGYGGAGRYVITYKHENYIKEMEERYSHFRFKPIQVYSGDGKYLFTDFNDKVAERLSVTRIYLNAVVAGTHPSVKGYKVMKAPFNPRNIEEVEVVA